MMARLLYFKNNYRVSFKAVWENFGQVLDQFKCFEIFNTHRHTQTHTHTCTTDDFPPSTAVDGWALNRCVKNEQYHVWFLTGPLCLITWDGVLGAIFFLCNCGAINFKLLANPPVCKLWVYTTSRERLLLDSVVLLLGTLGRDVMDGFSLSPWSTSIACCILIGGIGAVSTSIPS